MNAIPVPQEPLPPRDLNDRLIEFANGLLDDAQAEDVALDIKIDVFKAVSSFLASASRRAGKSTEEQADVMSFDGFRKRVAEAGKGE